MATVKGDVHDIGKNIVSVVLACNNYAITEDWEHAYVIGYITEPEVKSGDNLAKLPAGRGCDLYCSTNTNNLLGSLKLVYEPVDAE